MHRIISSCSVFISLSQHFLVRNFKECLLRKLLRRASGGLETVHTGVWEKQQKYTFRRALALQYFIRDCYPAPDLVPRKPVFLILLSGGALVAQTPVRSVFKISGLFLRPRPWQFEI